MKLIYSYLFNKFIIYKIVTVGIASETLNDWADEEAGLEAVQRVLDSLDDIHALQDALIDPDVLDEMLCDVKLHALLQVRLWRIATLLCHLKMIILFSFYSCTTE